MSAASRARKAYPEFDELAVAMLRSLVSTGAELLDPGSIGTVVHRHDGADAYEVEVSDPVSTVVTLRGRDLAAVA